MCMYLCGPGCVLCKKFKKRDFRWFLHLIRMLQLNGGSHWTDDIVLALASPWTSWRALLVRCTELARWMDRWMDG